MSGDAADTTRAAAGPGRWALLLLASGAWAVAVPYFATALGLELDVSAATEVADHVVPGLMVAGLAAVLARGVARGSTAAGDSSWLLATAAAFLAGFWITATHVPLLLEAPQGLSPWVPALVHLTAGPPVALTAGRMLLLREA